MSEVIDQSVLNGLLDSVGGDTDFLGELIETFLEDAPVQFSAMDGALESGDAEVFRRAAHSLKSNSASFGAMALTALCKQLEEIGKAGDLAAGSELLAKTREKYNEAAAALNAERNR